MDYTEMHVGKDAPVWACPEAFIKFLQDMLDRGPVLLVKDDGGYIVKRDLEVLNGDEKPALP